MATAKIRLEKSRQKKTEPIQLFFKSSTIVKKKYSIHPITFVKSVLFQRKALRLTESITGYQSFGRSINTCQVGLKTSTKSLISLMKLNPNTPLKMFCQPIITV